MRKFIDWAFYGKVPEGLETNTIYESYLIYCKLFGYDPMNKFEFIENITKYM